MSALVGVAPFNSDSGKGEHPRHIRGGRQLVRDVLYMGAQTGVQHNPRLKHFYDKLLAKGKKKKVALLAAARKMLTWLNTMMATQTAWDDTYHLRAVAN